MKQSLRRTIRAELRNARVLFQESRNSLILFVAIVIGGALIFHFVHDDHPPFSKALYSTFALVFFETGVLSFPRQWYLQMVYFVVPVLGLAAVVDGVLRFGTALTSKQARGQKWQLAMASTCNNHVIVCGMGRVGYRVTLELLKFGREIVAIEPDPECRFVEKAKELGIPVINADARRSETLIDAGVERADAIIPCTDDELSNLDIALDARELNPTIKVVMRMFDPDLAKRIERGFGIHTAFSTSALTAPIFAAAAMRVNVRYSFYVGDTLLNISELVVEPGSQLVGWSVEKLETELDLSVVCYQEEKTANLHPNPDLRLNAGTKILVMASLETLRRLNALNRSVTRQRY
jgi:Trk K+ transport system NAD-binding subunit